jgi:large subunit ribosomal protein L23
MNPILIRPLITEKMTSIQEKQGKYGFIVDVNANKIQIKKAIESTYGVNVMKLNTLRYDGKAKSRYTKAGVLSGRTASYKKAIVKLAAGETIDFYSNI